MILWLLFYNFFKIGLFTIGGGYAMIPMITEVVVEHGWLNVETVVDFIAVAESTPGPFAINIATFVGNHMGGLPGGILATLGVVLPSFLIILLIAKWFGKISDKPLVQAALDALRPAVVALIAAAVLTVAESAFLLDGEAPFLERLDLRAVGIFGVLLLLYRLFPKMHPIVLILIAAALGITTFGVLPMVLPLLG